MQAIHKKAQNTAEYAILIALVIGAAIAMQTYVKRSWQGGVKYAVDKIKKSGGTGQYEPYYLKSEYETKEDAYVDTVETKSGGGVERVFGSEDAEHKTERSGYQEITAAEDR